MILESGDKNVYKHLMRGSEENGNMVISVVASDRTKAMGTN